MFGPEVLGELRVSGVGGHGETQRPDLLNALSSANGAGGRVFYGWQRVAQDIASSNTSDLGPALSIALGSGGRAVTAHQNLLNSTSQDIDGFESRQGFSIGLVWNLSFAKWDRIREERVASRAARLRAERMEEMTVGETNRAFNDVQAARQNVGLAKEELDASEKTYKIEMARFKGRNGTRP